MILGLHVRLGNEDNIWGANRERATTLQQVKNCVELCKRFGRRVATAAEARKIMKVGVWYNSVDETLKALGMAPNPVDYNKGIKHWETDGKRFAATIASDSHPIAACMIPPAPVVEEQKKQKKRAS